MGEMLFSGRHGDWGLHPASDTELSRVSPPFSSPTDLTISGFEKTNRTSPKTLVYGTSHPLLMLMLPIVFYSPTREP